MKTSVNGDNSILQFSKEREAAATLLARVQAKYFIKGERGGGRGSILRFKRTVTRVRTVANISNNEPKERNTA